MLLVGNRAENFLFSNSQNIDQPLSSLKDPTGPKASWTDDKSHPAVASQSRDDQRRQGRAEALPKKPRLRTTPALGLGMGASIYELGGEMNCNFKKISSFYQFNPLDSVFNGRGLHLFLSLLLSFPLTTAPLLLFQENHTLLRESCPGD